MKKDQISINLESLQDRMGNTAEIRETMKGLKGAGYEYVEVLHFLNPDDGTTWKEILDECGMHASSIHELYEDIEKEPERMVEKQNPWAANTSPADFPDSLYGRTRIL